MTESGSPYAPPPPPASGFGPTTHGAERRSMGLRHLASVVLALGAAPVGILVFDYGAGEYLRERVVNFDQASAGVEIALMFLGALILMLVAVCGRLSGLGPVLAGLVWGLLPLLWFMVDFVSFSEFSRELPSTHFWFSDPPVLFALVAALLIGSGMAGRWRGQVVATSAHRAEPDAASGWQ